MKRLLIALLLVSSVSTTATAQYTDLKGLTFNAKKILYSEDGAVKSTDTYQLFQFSFKDMILVHNIMTESIESQVYKLQNLNVSYNSTTRKTIFKVDAVSGVSGSVYKYEVTINSEGVAELTLNGYLYTGNFYVLKSYVQN